MEVSDLLLTSFPFLSSEKKNHFYHFSTISVIINKMAKTCKGPPPHLASRKPSSNDGNNGRNDHGAEDTAARHDQTRDSVIDLTVIFHNLFFF